MIKIILFIIIISILIIYFFQCHEQFTNLDTHIILTTQPSNSIYSNSKYLDQKKVDYIIESLSKKDIKTDQKNTNMSILIDPLDFYKKLRKKYKLIKTNKGYFMYFSKIPISDTCTYNLEYKTIGYLTKTDFVFIKSIIKSYRMFDKTIKLVKLNPTVPNFNNVDLTITRIVRNSKLYDQISNLNLYVYGFKNIDINRIKLFYPFVKSHDTILSSFFNFSKILKFEEGTTNIPSISLNLLENIATIEITDDETEEEEDEDEETKLKKVLNEKIEVEEKNEILEYFITRLRINKNIYDEGYNCFNDEKNLNKALCNSKYDMVGKLKDYESLWDKRCVENKECPFYQKNKHYPNERGGCIINKDEKYGICEMPIGVTSVGYTKYKDKPFCYTKNGNCEDIEFPDLAFKNDTKDRLLNKKEIIISM